MIHKAFQPHLKYLSRSAWFLCRGLEQLQRAVNGPRVMATAEASEPVPRKGSPSRQTWNPIYAKGQWPAKGAV